jgi:hypothetical protein
VSSAKEMARAFARQANADYDTYSVLAARADIARCQSLHYLQMTSEKLVKAYLFRTQAALQLVQTSHAYVAKNLPLVLRAAYQRRHDKPANPWLFQEIHKLAREIELLAPAVDAAGSGPDNCEYPWEDLMGNVQVPADYDFPDVNLVKSAAGVLLVLLLELLLAIQDALHTAG